ncbi:uncharacterized protein LOC129229250 isoform X1 [Uloborus diversus]|uniref:uncharacterized protein LOC129229250 isoform X1 n=1 Tax=Uloborus diversus TaxID=327109 RepID=UPI0024093331|nr:uncharacterized protein LOC129229250 isoform X1 [Uloborus diversus]
MGKPSQHKYRARKRNKLSKSQRQRRRREALLKTQKSADSQSFLMYGNSFGDTITSDITNQHAEHTRTSLGYYSVLTTTGTKDNFSSDLESMTVNLDSALPTNIEDRFIGDDKESESFQCKKEPSSESNSNDASEFNELIPSGKESEVLQCKEKPSVENDSDKEPDSFLESPALTQLASHSPPHTPTVHIDLLIPRRPETYQMNSFMINPTSNSKSYQLQNSKKYEQEARIPVLEKPFSPVIVIKKEISDIEFNSEPQQCSNPEPQHCPSPEPQHYSNPEPQHCSNPEPQHCSNPKCLESISQLKKKNSWFGIPVERIFKNVWSYVFKGSKCFGQ